MSRASEVPARTAAPSLPRQVDVAVVGAGVTGLATAYYLHRLGTLTVAVLEAGDRAGGKVRTGTIAGVSVEYGPDSFLARGANVGALCSDLGLGDRLVFPSVSRAAIWSRGRLRRLPDGLQAGVPSRPAALVASGVLSVAGALRAALDLVLPATPVTDSTTVAEAVERRFGREARERLVDPLVGGIYAGDTTNLGLAAALPDLYAVATANRSVLLALRRRQQARGPALQTLSGGLQQLTDALATRLPLLFLGTAVTALDELPGGGFELSTTAGKIASRVVIFATPAFVTAAQLKAVDSRCSELLATIPYVSVATVALAYPRSQLRPTGSSGFLVPPSEGRLVTGATWVSEKWPQLGPDDVAVVRCHVGRAGDQRWRSLDDGDLLHRVCSELGQLTGVRAAPLAGQVTRWERALPQYTPGHGSRVAEVEARLARHPGLLVAGAAYRGVGISSCNAQGERAAAAAVDLLRSLK